MQMFPDARLDTRSQNLQLDEHSGDRTVETAPTNHRQLELMKAIVLADGTGAQVTAHTARSRTGAAFVQGTRPRRRRQRSYLVPVTILFLTVSTSSREK